MNRRVHLELFIDGIVQGVGFRPFVYNLAMEKKLKGFVLNNSRGVMVEAEGKDRDIQSFLESLRKNPPPLAEILSFSCEINSNIKNFRDFRIKESLDEGCKSVFISPDIGVCDECLHEIQDPGDRRFGYPFINCTNCGPRFTIIKDIPYDRKNTAMSDFPMCDFCRSQYLDPTDRRFHAQPVACPQCGPQPALLDSRGKPMCNDGKNAVEEASRLLKTGMIVAVKGLGGYHLAADALNNDAVCTLRSRKYREDKPFAVMVRDAEQAKDYCEIDRDEEILLTCRRGPIVLLKKHNDCPIARGVAPGTGFLGVMLPYTPLHYLLLEDFGGPLVMTSGNISDEPVCFRDDEALTRLVAVADYFLAHNRRILTRCDDTVTRIFREREYPLRRSRGYAPNPIRLRQTTEIPVLAAGAQLKNTFCLLKGNNAFISCHIGDLENESTFESFTEGIELYKKLFNVNPGITGYDCHPGYLSTQYAEKLECGVKIPIQHHHAHTASVMAEWGLEEPVIGVVLDGLGYGEKGELRGFEIMMADYSSYKRLAYLASVPLPGGDRAVKEPWRMAVSYLYEIFRRDFFNLNLRLLKEIPEGKINFIIEMMDKGVGSPLISSAGRLFDAASAITGIRMNCNYEAQAAVELENLAGKCSATDFYEFDIKSKDEICLIDPNPVITGLVEDLKKGPHGENMARKFHNTIARMILAGVEHAHGKTGIKKITLSGGVFQNLVLLEETLKLLERAGFTPFIHSRVPPNDAGISLGQAAVAAAVYKMSS